MDILLFGVTMSVPIFSSLRKSAKTQQAKIEFEKSKIDLTDSKNKILIELENANSEYEYALNSYNNAVENLKLAEKIEKRKSDKIFRGFNFWFRILDRHKFNFTQSKMNYFSL